MRVWGPDGPCRDDDFGSVVTEIYDELVKDGHLAVADELRFHIGRDLEQGEMLKTLSVRQGHAGNALWYGHRCLGSID